MSTIHKERINEIRKIMNEKGIDLYYIPMDDCHNSEYVGDHFKTIEYVSGFSGSAASIVITIDEAFLWTDGRYFLQAETELLGSGIKLMKSGQPGILKPEEYINQKLACGSRLGFDGKVVNCDFVKKITFVNEETDVRPEVVIDYGFDPIDTIWKERPKQRFSKIFSFDKYSGESSISKLKRVRDELKKISTGRYLHIINSLDDIAWLFNIRAGDVAYNPTAYAYAAISEDDAWIYTGNGAADDVRDYFKSINVKVGDYIDFQNNVLKHIPESTKVVLINKKKISYDMFRLFCDSGSEVIDIENPTTNMKAIKNETEIKNILNAQIKDGVAVTKCMKWIKENAGCDEISECDVADKLIEFRSLEEDFIEPSFATIAGYKENAAIIHYEPKRGTDKKIDKKGMLLVDSGGHYKDGTTDTTRTFILGDITEEEMKCFSIVSASMLRLLSFDSKKAIGEFNGLNADAVAREVIKEHGYNYNHGTGHGIGYVMNVHEDPPRISPVKEGTGADSKFKPGMITSNEPGIYVDGCFGIRCENDMLVIQKEDEDGKYLAFENMTFVPIDTDGIDKSVLTDEDVIRLNNYNQTVYNALEKRVDEDMRKWLEFYTRPI